MPRTEIRSNQILDSTIDLVDLDATIIQRMLPYYPLSDTMTYQSAAQVLAAGANQILFQTNVSNNTGEYSTSTSTWTSASSQNLLVSGNISITSTAANTIYYVMIYKNGTMVWTGTYNYIPVAVATLTLPFSHFLRTVVGDTIKIYVNAGTAGKSTVIGATKTFVNFVFNLF